MIKISTSILTAKNRQESINKLNNTNTDYIHIDIMDNKFVKNYQFPPKELNELLKLSTKPVDIHLMVEDPEKYINNFVDNKNIETVTIHLEINKNLPSIIKKIKDLGFQAGLAIKPQTKTSELDKYLELIDLVLVMSVEPGFGGQTFINNTYQKINEIKSKKQNILIEVDGGINNTNINTIKNTADIAVVGSYITNKEDYNEAINTLKN